MQFRESPGAEDGKPFAKLKDKESVTGVFRGEIYEFRQHWLGNKSEFCIGAGCPYCSANPPNNSSFRFRLNLLVIDQATGEITAKVFEQGWTVYTQLRDFNKEYELSQTIVKITRNGEKKETTYTILPIKNGTITPEREAKLSQVKLLDLTHKTVEEPPHSAESVESGPVQSEDIPF